MSATKTKAKNAGGRPKGESPPLGSVTFRADPAVLDAIERLTAAATADISGLAAGGARSFAIRRALLAAAAALNERRK
ncbi:MAG: hypothetical protein ABI445_08930 [Polyangia bacterium]